VKLVVDANILIAALMKESAVRELLLNPLFEFYVPEHCIKEIERHIDEISERSGLGVEDVFLLLGVLMASVQVVSAERVLRMWKEAEDVMCGVDRDDIPFVALALSFPSSLANSIALNPAFLAPHTSSLKLSPT
jgi:predicted nucleic acid-binding protein